MFLGGQHGTLADSVVLCGLPKSCPEHPLSHAVEQVARCDVKPSGEAHDGRKARFSFRAFEQRNLRPVQVARRAERLLREPKSLPLTGVFWNTDWCGLALHLRDAGTPAWRLLHSPNNGILVSLVRLRRGRRSRN